MIGSKLNQLNSMKILLATKSSPRRQLLENIGIKNFKLVDSGFEENIDKTNLTSQEYVKLTCQGKFQNFIQNSNKDFHLAFFFDTITVDKTDKIFEKPKNEQEHFNTIKGFAGDKHFTMTYFVLAYNVNKLNELYNIQNDASEGIYI